MELDRPSGVPGTVVTVTATLSGNAPAATNVTLLAANTTIVPGLTRVTVPQGASFGTATFTTGPVASQTPVLITASLAGSANQTVTFTGLVPAPTLVSLVLSPRSGLPGDVVTGTVTLSSASIGATTVDLATSDGVIAPAGTWMQVYDGQTIGTFSFVVGAVSARKQVTVTASLAGSPDQSDTFTGLTYVVFVTGDPRDGNFGGLAGADAFCQARADAGVANGTLPSGHYVAFLSTSAVDAKDRIADVAYGLSDGTPIAASKADLLSGTIANWINRDENGQALFADVWTGSTTSGTVNSTDQCADWTSNSSFDSGKVGDNGYTTLSRYISNGSFAYPCSNLMHVYCFQQPPNVVFVTSTQHDGNFGSLANADAFCQARADVGIAAGALPAGTYVAYLSTSTVDAKDRIVDAQYMLPDRTLVAASRADLTDGSLLHSITQDETGSPTTQFVWTGTNADGTASGYTCSDWTSASNSAAGELGVSSMPNYNWSSATPLTCNNAESLYCFQQPSKKKVVFVTSVATQHNGNFGGLAGADAFCQTRAAAGAAHGIPQGQTWRAFMSDSTTDAIDRIVDAKYALPDGTLVAASKADLADGGILHAIDQDELGNSGVAAGVHTGSDVLGKVWNGHHCNNWTVDSGFEYSSGRGVSTYVNGYWVVFGFGACGLNDASVYCFQQ